MSGFCFYSEDEGNKTLRNVGVYVSGLLCLHSPECCKISHPYLTPWGWIILENLTTAQLLKKYAGSIMWGTGKFITVVTNDRLAQWTKSTHPTPYFLEICSNHMHTSMSWSCKWSPFRSFTTDFSCISYIFHDQIVSHPPPPLDFTILIMFVY